MYLGRTKRFLGIIKIRVFVPDNVQLFCTAITVIVKLNNGRLNSCVNVHRVYDMMA